jgi:hypothetical protein
MNFTNPYNQNFDQEAKVTVGKISFISKKDRQKEKLKPLPQLTMDSFIKQDMDELEFNNQMYKIQDTIYDANKELRSQRMQKDRLEDEMLRTEFKISEENNRTVNDVMDAIQQLRNNLKKTINESSYQKAFISKQIYQSTQDSVKLKANTLNIDSRT